MDQKITIDHIGWITNDVELFEKFWVSILGFERVWESDLSNDLTIALFNIPGGAKCYRYKRGDIVIEVHKFTLESNFELTRFDRYGINHIGLHLEDRKKFLEGFKGGTHIFHNPKGWDNIFIRDFEGNWVELKETFK